MEDLVFVSAQPDIPYFHWQTKIYTHNFIEKGIEPNKIHVLFVMVNGSEPTLESLKLKEVGVNVHHFEDTRSVSQKRYIPTLRPLALSQWLKENPKFGKCYFYHDSDIIFRKLPDFDSLINDDICYLSDTISYIGYNYVKECSKRYETKFPNLKTDELLETMCEIVGIDRNVLEENQKNSGGAQYLIKDTDYKFWEKIFNDCNTLYNKLLEFSQKHPIHHHIQMWTADMWAVLWNIWLLDKKTNVTDKLDFSWATDNITRYEQKPIFHLAGVTDNLKTTKFYKGEYINSDPIEKLRNNPNHFDYVDKNSATVKYVEVMKSLIEKTEI
jgi:hypothetical protein